MMVAIVARICSEVFSPSFTYSVLKSIKAKIAYMITRKAVKKRVFIDICINFSLAPYLSNNSPVSREWHKANEKIKRPKIILESSLMIC